MVSPHWLAGISAADLEAALDRVLSCPEEEIISSEEIPAAPPVLLAQRQVVEVAGVVSVRWGAVGAVEVPRAGGGTRTVLLKAERRVSGRAAAVRGGDEVMLADLAADIQRQARIAVSANRQAAAAYRHNEGRGKGGSAPGR